MEFAELNDPAKFRALMLTNDGRSRYNRWVSETTIGEAYDNQANRFPSLHIGGVGLGKLPVIFWIKRTADAA